MARLNDPPQPTGETVESLKRRFIRQNRELARVNSTQSVRIRTLEGEVSRLLAENVSIREQVIKLHHEVERQPGDSAWGKVEDLKNKLEHRLLEFGGLLQELGAVRESTSQPPVSRVSSSTKDSLEKSRSQKPWKAPIESVESSWENEGRLPPIQEDKSFPRRTLDAAAIQALGPAGELFAESPDPGPPPKVHLDETDEWVSDGETKRLRPHESKEQSTTASNRIEARKRRRESQHQTTYPDESVESQESGPSTSEYARDRPSKHVTGRRTSSQYPDEHKSALSATQEPKLDRKRKIAEGARPSDGSKRSDNAASNGSRTFPTTTAKTSIEAKARTALAGRKALAPKSVNLDPQSPVKKIDGPLKYEKTAPRAATVKFAPQRSQPSAEGHQASSKTDYHDSSQTMRKESHNALAPKTPVLDDLDLFSPTVSDPSEPRPERGDTPPPPDLGLESGTGSFGRTSRRSRGSVSYAEPNLRDKMRRPTKELIDAVSAIDKARLAQAAKQSDITSLSSELAHMEIKTEESEGALPKWATKPVFESRSQQERQKATTSSPLSKKAQTVANDLPPSVATNRRRRASSVGRKDEQDRPEAESNTGAAINALSQTARRGPKGVMMPIKGEDAAPIAQDSEFLERTSIFDFTSSSPEQAQERGKVDKIAKPARSSRRHSSVPASGEQIEKRPIRSEVGTGELAARKDDVERSGLRSSRSTVGLERTDEGGSLGRAASRRRSMMI